MEILPLKIDNFFIAYLHESSKNNFLKKKITPRCEKSHLGVKSLIFLVNRRYGLQNGRHLVFCMDFRPSPQIGPPAECLHVK